MDVEKVLKKIDGMPDEEIDEMMKATFDIEDITASELMDIHAALVRYLKTPEGLMSDVLGDGRVKELMLCVRNAIKEHLGTYGINIEED